MKLDSQVSDLFAQLSKEFPSLNLKIEEMVIIETTELTHKLFFKREIIADSSV